MSQPVIVSGAGVQGLMLAYDLALSGYGVTVLEAAPFAGGLAAAMSLPELDGLAVDRFYHCILSSDRRLRALLEELSLAERLRFTTTGMGFWGGGASLHAMSSPREFLTFPLLGPLERLRLGLGLAWSAWGVRDGAPLESEPIGPWLRRVTGDAPYERLWGPLLSSKFEGRFDDLPASYMWSRLRRMLSTRDKTTGAEQMGHLIGGYQALVDALVGRVRALGGEVRLGVGVRALRFGGAGEVVGVEAEAAQGERLSLEARAVVLTQGNPQVGELVPEPPPALREALREIDYLAIVCPLLVLDRSLSPYYTINVVDRRLSMTGVIETTRIIDPALLGGRHLVYLPYYCRQGSALLSMRDDEVWALALRELGEVIPGFDPSWVQAKRVMRARHTEPIHRLLRPGEARPMVPYRSGVPGLYVANSTQVYPDLVNCEAMAANVSRALAALHGDLDPSRAGRSCLSR
jgi:protoporphyrinogen oxidase